MYFKYFKHETIIIVLTQFGHGILLNIDYIFDYIDYIFDYIDYIFDYIIECWNILCSPTYHRIIRIIIFPIFVPYSVCFDSGTSMHYSRNIQFILTLFMKIISQNNSA